MRGLDGQVFLRLDLQHVGHPAKSAPERLHPSMPAVREVVRLGEFEGSSAVALGVRSRHGDPVRQGFRAFVSGQSLVIDVAHVGAWEAATR